MRAFKQEPKIEGVEPPRVEGIEAMAQEVERNIAAFVPRQKQALPLPPYVEHIPGTSEIGKLSAQAVAAQFETAAKQIEAMGADMIELARRCEAMAAKTHEAVKWCDETANVYREEAKGIFERIERATLTADAIIDQCRSMKDRIAAEAPPPVASESN